MYANDMQPEINIFILTNKSHKLDCLLTIIPPKVT